MHMDRACCPRHQGGWARYAGVWIEAPEDRARASARRITAQDYAVA
jgi:hypothetical protein